MIGVGYLGRFHAQKYAQLPGCRLVAVVDAREPARNAVAAELGYTPNPHARALQTGRQKTIAMVISDITNPHFFELIRGAEQRAKAAENTLVIVNAEESPTIERDQVKGLMRSVDGFILAASRLPDQDLLALAANHYVVLVDRELGPLPSVAMDTGSVCPSKYAAPARCPSGSGVASRSRAVTRMRTAGLRSPRIFPGSTRAPQRIRSTKVRRWSASHSRLTSSSPRRAASSSIPRSVKYTA